MLESAPLLARSARGDTSPLDALGAYLALVLVYSVAVAYVLLAGVEPSSVVLHPTVGAALVVLLLRATTLLGRD